jgi:5'-nucleotidase/UDP-sugar diphosphatase
VDTRNIIGGYPQIGGASLVIKNGVLTKIEARNKSWKVELVNNRIESTKNKYILGTMNFLAKGGDNYPKISDHKNYIDTGFMINTAMMNYVEKNKIINPSKWEKNLNEIIILK